MADNTNAASENTNTTPVNTNTTLGVVFRTVATSSNETALPSVVPLMPSRPIQFVPGLALTVKTDLTNKIVEITDDLHVNTITKLNFTHTASAWIEGSIDGLLLLHDENDAHYLFNPITRDYIHLHHPYPHPFYTPKSKDIIYGFGVSKITGLYKVVSMMMGFRSVESKVYTLGTGLWRSVVPPPAQVTYTSRKSGIFVSGSLHWVTHDSNATLYISCFDLETELFSTFSPPPLIKNVRPDLILIALEGSLCLCEYTYTMNDRTLNIWLMKEYGVEESWTKEFVIQSEVNYYPIRLSKDGVILMGVKNCRFVDGVIFDYCSKNKTTQRIRNIVGYTCNIPVSHTPSLLSLKSFGMSFSSFLQLNYFWRKVLINSCTQGVWY
ncbi:hypothetical protein ACS0TY_036889 [Phlomoides rotata]